MPATRDNSLFRLGKYISLALLLPASVAAGYFVGAAVADWLHAPIIKVLGVLLGAGAGLTKVLQAISREDKMGGPRP
ncbi:MAG: hypothetical protein ACRD4O_17060 [Bryobacteraceae bacterium]